MKFDTLVLGAGIIGVSVAVHLQKRGRSVALVDRKAPGNETSFGNAGLIQREGVYPYAFPRDLATMLRYASNRHADVRFHLRAMPGLAPFLWSYWRNSAPARHAQIARAYAPLIAHSVSEHRALAAESGASALAAESGASALIRPGGWIRVFRTNATWEAEAKLAERWRQEFGVDFEVLDPARLREAEPSLASELPGGLRYTQADAVSDPHALVTAYAAYLETLGGRVLRGDANTLSGQPGQWEVQTDAGPVSGASVVVAMGPWSDQIPGRLGYRLPLAVKRGYHMHYEATPGARLNHPVLDDERGYLLAPMARGIRLTTGAELAHRDAPKTPVQLDAVEPVARALFPLGKRLDDEPWMGSRPCMPDMMPVIGPAPRHDSLWFAFGHGHHGLTLGPVTGRLLAEMMTGEAPFMDPHPFRADRF